MLIFITNSLYFCSYIIIQFLHSGFTFDFIYFWTIRERQQEENKLETENLPKPRQNQLTKK
ncbi:hypothetical protein JHK86_027431 [Glycine max]|nr:hypothetical protein JHK86_027431 [Glycine max]